MHQWPTVDPVHVLAAPGLDRHAAYVALSRHRDRVGLHYGRDDFADRSKLVRTLSRERGKDMASGYTRSFADRRQIQLPQPVWWWLLCAVSALPGAEINTVSQTLTSVLPCRL